MKQIVIRMKYNTFLRIKRQFKPFRNESAADYFQRLAQHLEYWNDPSWVEEVGLK